jgi:thiamine pyrophosphokinase
VDKDATDLELALDAALVMEPERLLVLAGDGGRLDHTAATLLLLGAERYAGVELDAHIGAAQAHVIRRARSFTGDVGELVSLLALHGAAEGITTEGLRYPLRDETLEAGSSRGVSNVFSAKVATVSLEHGILLAIRPGEAK